MWKKLTALVLALCLVSTLVVPGFAAEKSLLRYKSAAFLGDSISLGYTQKEGLDNAYDFYKHLYSWDSDYAKEQREASNTDFGNPYTGAYPFVFGEKAGINLDYVYNYGISGAMAADIAVMLDSNIKKEDFIKTKIKGKEIEFRPGDAWEGMDDSNMLRSSFGKAISKSEYNGENFIETMRENIGKSDLVAMSLGGNDIYQNFLTGYQFNIRNWGGLGTLGILVNILALIMQFEMPLSYLEKIPALLGEYIGGGDKNDVQETKVQMDQNDALTANANEGTVGDSGSGIAGLLGSLDLVGGIQALLNYYNKDNIYEFFHATRTDFDSILDTWKESYEKIIDEVITLQKKQFKNGDIAIISQYNPFGTENYLQFLIEKLKSGDLMKDLGADAYMAARVVRQLISSLESAVKTTTAGSAQQIQLIIKAFSKALDELLPLVMVEKEYEYVVIGDEQYDVEDIKGTEYEKLLDYLPTQTGTKTDLNLPTDNDSLYELIADLAYPMMVYMIGGGLQPIYDEMNEFLKDLAAKKNKENPWRHIYFVDISDAPSSGRMDPHPGEEMHEWIAQRIYDSLVASKYYLPAPTGSARTVISVVKNVVKMAKDYLSGAAQDSTGATPVNTSIMQQFLNLQKTFLEKLFQMPVMKQSKN